jgi:hypothetical protein
MDLKVAQHVDTICLFFVGILHMEIFLDQEAHLVTKAI